METVFYILKEANIDGTCWGAEEAIDEADMLKASKNTISIKADIRKCILPWLDILRSAATCLQLQPSFLPLLPVFLLLPPLPSSCALPALW